MIISKNTPKPVVLKLAEDCGAGCNASHHCCRHDSGYLAEDDLKKIAGYLGISEEKLKKEFLQEKRIFNTIAIKPKTLATKKPYGPCVFLDDKKGCKIHSVKPTQCRLYTCKEYGGELMHWFYLNYLVNAQDPQSVREYAEFLQFNTPIPGGNLEELVPDKQKLDQMLSYKIFQAEKEESQSR